MKIFLFLTLMLFVNDSNIVHQDTPLQIDQYGNIKGLPKKYSPAKFDKLKGKLQIKNNTVLFPNCLKQYFHKLENPKLYLSASWYHSKEIMPYYINFVIYNKDSDYSYHILVDLDSLELIEIYKETKEENSYYHIEIELSQNCINEYQSNVELIN